MNFDRENTFELPEGKHERGGMCVALCGTTRCSTRWAMDVLNLLLPTNAHRAMIAVPNDFDPLVAMNEAVRIWIERNRKFFMRHLVVFPVDTPLRPDAVIINFESDAPVQEIGGHELPSTYLLRARDEHDDFGGGPFFGTDERGAVVWVGPGECVRRSAPEHSITPLRQIEPPKERRAPTSFDESVYVTGLPTLGKISLHWLCSTMQVAGPVGMTRILIAGSGYEVADARTALVEAALSFDPAPAYLFFLGDDNLMPALGLKQLFDTLRREQADAVCGLYHMKYHPPNEPLLWRAGTAGHLIAGVDFQPGEVIEVDGTGLDAALIRTEVFTRIPKPWFKTGHTVQPNGDVLFHTEDAHFWRAFKQATGRGPLVATGVRVGHYNWIDGGIY